MAHVFPINRLPRASGGAPTGCSVAAQQTEGVFGVVFARETTGRTKQDPLRLTSFGTSPAGAGEAKRWTPCVKKWAVKHDLGTLKAG